MSQLDYTGLKRLHREWRRRGHPRLGLMLDRVQNPLNMGAIVRTASAERVEHLYLIDSASPDASKAAKTAMGTERYLAWSAFDDAASALAAARRDGYRTVAVELASEARPLHELDLTGEIVMALGNENHGLSAALLESCDEVGFIPQLGRVGSLNVAAATAIAVYEARRQQWTQGPART